MVFGEGEGERGLPGWSLGGILRVACFSSWVRDSSVEDAILLEGGGAPDSAE